MPKVFQIHWNVPKVYEIHQNVPELTKPGFKHSKQTVQRELHAKTCSIYRKELKCNKVHEMY